MKKQEDMESISKDPTVSDLSSQQRDKSTFKFYAGSRRKLSGKAANIVQGFIRFTCSDDLTSFDTNYYRCKRVTEAVLPLLKCPTKVPRIVILSSLRGDLKRNPIRRSQTSLTILRM
ncbi:uncharacterized protein LOC109827728 isoform X2 [Asparagus officinalis]|uniref:uncharacterized protein LOC109827728 isoform X2 n=1 Tax=Asparagus officinalis TaxID=4686 RepID=UPI00098E0085|nr:uncharacterized protein LOC109827728 isoform X2 [Asparagus officinalis]